MFRKFNPFFLVFLIFGSMVYAFLMYMFANTVIDHAIEEEITEVTNEVDTFELVGDTLYFVTEPDGPHSVDLTPYFNE